MTTAAHTRSQSRSAIRKTAFALVMALGTLNGWCQPAQIILLRHAEKPPDEANIHLSEQGQRRARALAEWLTTTPAVTNTGLPAVLFGAHLTPHGHAQRTHETLEPLAQRLQLPIQAPFLSKDYAALARRILTSNECRGKTVVVCWTHEFLAELAAALGVRPKPSPWKGGVYDRAWIIRRLGDKTTLANLPQRLLPGDARH